MVPGTERGLCASARPRTTWPPTLALARSRHGSELKAFYLTMGRYDIVVIIEAPDDATAAKVALTVGSSGDISTETLRAFSEDEFREIVAALP